MISNPYEKDRNMNLRDLKYLVALAEHRHFGKAAEACFVSQPALSMQIKKLEGTLGVQLLERTNKSVLLTKVGTVIAEQAQHVLRQVKELQETAKQAKDPYSGELRMGVIPTLAPYLLPHIIPALAEKFSKLSIYLSEAQTAQSIEHLKQGKLDVALLALPIQEIDLSSLPLFEEEFVLAVPATHSLAKRKLIKHSDLEKKTLLLLEDGHCLREQALALCHRAKASETLAFQATSLETLRHMVASNIGITLMPRLACKTNDGITYLPIHMPKSMRIIGLVYRASSAKKPLLKDLGTHIKKILAKLNTIKVI